MFSHYCEKAGAPVYAQFYSEPSVAQPFEGGDLMRRLNAKTRELMAPGAAPVPVQPIIYIVAAHSPIDQHSVIAELNGHERTLRVSAHQRFVDVVDDLLQPVNDEIYLQLSLTGYLPTNGMEFLC